MRQSCGNTYTASQRRGDLHLEFAYAVDAGVQLVACLHRSDTRRRSGVDEVTRLERVVLGKVGNRRGYRPDHVGQVGFLPLLAVDVEPDRAFGRMADFGRGREHAARRAFVEILAEVPRPAV